MPRKKINKGPYNVDLQHAVDYLYEQNIIDQDGEIAKRVKLSKGVVSTYLNGKAPMSDSFKTSFETAFNIKISDFRAVDKNNVPAHHDDTYRDKYINLLEDNQAFFKEMFRTSLGAILDRTQEMWSRQKGTGEVVLESLERIEKKKPGSLVDEADKRTHEIDIRGHKPGSAVAQGN